jgi:hypothetical protein
MLRKYGVDQYFTFPLISASAQDFDTGPTLAAGDAKVWTDNQIFTNLSAEAVAFTLGSEKPTLGDTIDGATSAASGTFMFAVVSSGTFGGGDAAGTLFLKSVSGTFQSENLDINGGTANVMTIGADTTAGLIGEVSNGMFCCALTAAEMQCTQAEIHIIDSATKEWEDQGIKIETIGHASAMHPQFDANVTQISGDATAADNLELQYDGTGLTGDTFPAPQSQVGSIGSAGGGGRNFAADHDNTTRDTIDNAAAVDKGGGLVGIPVTGHAFFAGNEITIAGSTNYNGAEDIVSQTTNEIVITAPFVSETFAGTETIVSSIKGIIFVGTLSSGTFADTESDDGVYQVIAHDSNAFDIVYRIPIGAARLGTDIFILGYLNSGNDQSNVQVYDFIGSVWKTVKIWEGQNGAADTPIDAKILDKHTGTGADLGICLLRIVTTGQTAPTLNVEQLLIEAVSSDISVGYVRDAAVSYDTDPARGEAGVDPERNGTADNPSDNEADTTTLTVSKKLPGIHIASGSVFTFDQNYSKYTFSGGGGQVALAGFEISRCRFFNLSISGVSTGSVRTVFTSCAFFSATTVELGTWIGCAIANTITLSGANTYRFRQCDFTDSGELDFGAVGAQTIYVDHHSGHMLVQNLAAGDAIFIHGTGNVTLNANCTGGTVDHSSDVVVTDNSGNVSLSVDPTSANAIQLDGSTQSLTDLKDFADDGYDPATNKVQGVVLVDTTTVNTDQRGTDSALTDKDGFTLSVAGILAVWHQALAQIVTAGSVGKLLKDEITSVRMATLTDWINGGRLDLLLDAIPTVTEFEARTILAAAYFDPAVDQVSADITAIAGNTPLATSLKEFIDANVIESDTAQGGTSTTITLAAGSNGTDDYYKDYGVYINGGTGVGQFARINSYNGTSKIATIATPVNGWAVTPDVTSTYILLSSGVETHVSEIHSGAISAASFSADAIDAAAVAADASQEIADEVLKRAVSNVEDTADRHSLAAGVMVMTNSSIFGTTLTAKKPSNDNVFQTYTVVVDAAADPITGVS